MNDNPEGTPNPLNPTGGASTGEKIDLRDLNGSTGEPAATETTGAPIVQPQEMVAETAAAEVQASSDPASLGLGVENINTGETDNIAAESLMVATGVSEPESAAPVNSAEMPSSAESGNTAGPVAETPDSTMVAKDSVVEDHKKKGKIGIIIGVVLCAAALICGGIVLAMNLINNKDAVPTAMSKLMSGDIPENVSISGVASASMVEAMGPIDSYDVNFTAALKADGSNKINATVSALAGGEVVGDFSASEIQVADGDVYLQLGGVNDLIEALLPVRQYQPLCSDGSVNCAGGQLDCGTDVDNCIQTREVMEIDATECTEGDTECVTTSITVPEQPTEVMPIAIDPSMTTMFNSIDGEWIRLPANTPNIISNLLSNGNPATCLISAANNLDKYKENIAAIYNNNQFIEYSTNNLAITAKKDSLYRLTFNSEKLAGFINALATSGFMNDLNACMGNTATNVQVTADDLTEMLEVLPIIYVEIDGDYRFTRVYLNSSTEEASMELDLSISYPGNLTIEEPTTYVDINTLMQQNLNDFLQTEVIDVEQ